MKLRILHFSIFALLFVSGCKTPESTFDPRYVKSEQTSFQPIEEPPELDLALLKPSNEPYLIGVGDVVEIEIAEIPGTRAETFVMPDGRLFYDLAGGIKADGKTVKELSAMLQEALKYDYASPSVNVTLREVRSRRYWVLGRVFKPGLYPMKQPTTLLEAISRAGGLFTSRFTGTTEELADLGNSFVMREGKVLPVNFEALLRDGNMDQNIYLKADDYIYLPSALSQNVYVLGHVRQPQAVGFKDRLTLVGAIAHAKGPIAGAHLDRVAIIRGSLTNPKVAFVNFSEILSGDSKDFNLAPFDIVWVPKSPWTRVDQYVWTILNTAARTIAVNEGSRFADLNEDPNVTIPISVE